MDGKRYYPVILTDTKYISKLRNGKDGYLMSLWYNKNDYNKRYALDKL